MLDTIKTIKHNDIDVFTIGDSDGKYIAKIENKLVAVLGDDLKLPDENLVFATNTDIDNIDNLPLKDYVDLGLPSGTLWATCNIGANTPEEAGLYFAWGETQGYTADQIGTGEGKKAFSWSDYELTKDGGLTFTKYNGTDKTVLDKEDDAAYQATNGRFRMPTHEQQIELFRGTNLYLVVVKDEKEYICPALGEADENGYMGSGWNFSQIDGGFSWNGSSQFVKGIRFENKSDSIKFIFVPAVGSSNDGSLDGVGSCGCFWSSSLCSGIVLYAYHSFFYGDAASADYNLIRYVGQSVRGVLIQIPTDEHKKIISLDELAYYDDRLRSSIVFTENLNITHPIGWVTKELINDPKNEKKGIYTLPTQGKSIQEGIQMLLSKEDYPKIIAYPTISNVTLTCSTSDLEVGNIVNLTTTISTKNGSYSLGGITPNCSIESYNFKGPGVNSTTEIKQLNNIYVVNNITLQENITYQSLCSYTYDTDKNMPLTNLGNPAGDDYKIPAATTNSVSSNSLKAYRKIFYGYKLDESINANSTSNDIRTLGNWATSSTTNFTLKYPENTRLLIIAIYDPNNNRTIKSAIKASTPGFDDVGAFNLRYRINVHGANEYSTAPYSVIVLSKGKDATLGPDTMKIQI